METFLQFLYSLLAATALAGLAAWRKALTRGGLLLAWALAAVIGFCGGPAGFLALAATFVFTIAAGKLSGRGRERIEQTLHAKTGRRDAVQILCNVAVGALMLLLRRLTGWPGFLWAYGGAMAASLSDSMASELGVLSRRPPRDICTWRPVAAGLSGGVTLLGLAAAALGALLVGGIYGGVGAYGAAMSLSVAGAGFFASLCDSVLGSAAQAKYHCPRCGALTEKPRHCGVPGALARGAGFITNDTVNLINNAAGALAAMLLYGIHT